MNGRCQENSVRNTAVTEKQFTLQAPSGFQLRLQEMTFNHLELRWGSYENPAARELSFHPDKKAIVSHFRLQDAGAASTHAIREKEFVIYREAPEAYQLQVPATRHKTRSFFELLVPEDFFMQLFTTESRFMDRFQQNEQVNIPSPEFTARMLPGMYAIIHDLQHAPFTGTLKAAYLETKATELFLSQVWQLDQPANRINSRLAADDVARLHSIKDYISRHYNQSLSITALARTAGINQLKLKNGFKALFHTTVFGYIAELRMNEAKRLLLEEKMMVNEVADRIGYRYPQHFTAAFRKKFGLLPKDLKN
ncbi:helix-turn-helix transcriptional regulator [Chitinophaga arvensicola]|uniref:AraC-type DNA-binding protein n=1 Tax=Chitinophaga arvensicola TaxID=29529 RepID=A0A1I0RFY5_9BACT|nr:AraC family transcriptional regulator [Chitinophaga arvensicola]SEW39596.1 AraC-type DNA-binding protein [Chitinophaga arvensicola]